MTLRPIEYWGIEHLTLLGDRLIQLRREQGWTQRALADAAGLNPSSLARIEHGQRRTRASTLGRIVKALGYTGVQATDVLAELVALAGPALAEESPWTTRKPMER